MSDPLRADAYKPATDVGPRDERLAAATMYRCVTDPDERWDLLDALGLYPRDSEQGDQ